MIDTQGDPTMRVNRPMLLAALMFTAALAGCALLTPGQQSAPSPPGSSLVGGVTAEPTPGIEIQTGDLGPVPTPDDAPVQAGTAALGELLFVRDGQVYATTIDTASERPLTSFEPGRALRGLTLSPDARLLAFTLDGSSLAVLDLSQGTLRTFEADEPTIVSSPVWSPSSDALYFQRTRLDIETYSPEASVVVRLDPTSGDTVEITSADFAEGREVTPVAALPDNRLVIAESNPLEDSAAVALNVWSDGALTPLDIRGLSAAGFAAFSPDGTFALFIDPTDPAALLLVPFDTESTFTGAIEIARLSDGVFQTARLAPGGVILALASDGPYLLTPAGGGDFTLTALDAGAEGERTLALAYQSEGTVIAARLPADGGRTELVTLPTDGAAGALLTLGEQPVVVNAWQ